MEQLLPPRGRLAAIDYGTVRLGLAVTDPDRILASPHANYTRRGTQHDATYLRAFVQDENIVGLVVGLPIHLSGDESPKSREAREFATWLHQITGLPVCLFDERFTSVEASALLSGASLTKRRRKERLDKLAAQILLTAYLEKEGGLDRPA